MQGLINSMSSGWILIKAGLYSCTINILLKSNINIFGEGDGTILQVAAGRPNGLITDHQYWHIFGQNDDVTISHITIADLVMDGNYPNNMNLGAVYAAANIYLTNCGGFTLLKVISKNARMFGFEACSSGGAIKNVKILGCSFYDNCWNHIHFWSTATAVCSVCDINGNYLQGGAEDVGIALGSDVLDHPCTRINILNNIIDGMTGSLGSAHTKIAIDIECGSHCIISNNQCLDVKSGIVITAGGGYHVISSNKIVASDVAGAGPMLNIYQNQNYNIVSDNLIISPATHAAHLIFSQGSYSKIQSNICKSGGGWARNLECGDNNEWNFNTCIGLSAPAIEISGATNYKIRCNKGFVDEPVNRLSEES